MFSDSMGVRVTYVVAAKDPEEGATVMAVCRTRSEAAALWVKFRDEGLKDIETTDSAGHRVDEHDLAGLRNRSASRG
jgi:hypothetical protein